MKTGKTRKALLQLTIDNIDYIRSDTKISEEVKSQLGEYGVLEGEVQKIFNHPNSMKDIDIRLLGLIAEQIYLKTGLQDLNLDNWFNPVEITEMRQYYFQTETDVVEFPLVIENVFMAGRGVWICPLDVKIIARLMKASLLYYNFDIQRQATNKKRLEKTIATPTVNKKNVKEMTELLLKEELIPTSLAFNGAIRTAESGEEFTFDSKMNTLTINKGTRLDILDGYHRCLASLEAYSKNPDIEFNFVVQFSNYSTKQAQQYQSQLAKATPIPKERIRELEAKRYADVVVRQLKTESELKNKISSSKKLSITAGEIVNYGVLANAIDSEFPMKSKLDALDVGDYLTEFFDYLLGYFTDRFNQTNSDDLLRHNKMFYGYVVLAKRFRDNEIPFKKIKTTLENIEFNRSNKDWSEYKIIKDGYFTTNAEKGIKDYFDKIEIK